MLPGTELPYCSATDVLRLFRARELSPVEFMEAIIERASVVEPHINAFADTYFDEAIEKAHKAEAKYMKAKGRVRSLEGLPLAIKDDTAMKGRRTTSGALIFKDHVDTYTNPSVERLIRAGAIVHARTTCPEFCWAWVCYSRIHGVTRNPWNPDYTPGGSSGGSAAALAAGTTPLATGTDSAGSIRMPAAMCGVVGYKPPYGRNPESPPYNLDMYCHIGPMTRTIADCILMQNIMSGPHPGDHATVKPGLQIPKKLKGIKGLKIAYSIDLGYYEVADDVRKNTLNALSALRLAGAAVHEVPVDWAGDAIRAASNYGDHLYADVFEDAIKNHSDLVTDYTPFFARLSAEVTQAEFHESYYVAGKSWEAFGALLKRYDAFVCPTVATQDMLADMKPWHEGFMVNGKPVDPNGGWVMTILFNMFNRCPVISVPSGFTKIGLPTGIQIVGRTFDDVRVFRIAAALERERPWFDTAERQPTLSMV